MVDNTYKIRYRKGEFELEIQGDKEFVVEKFQELSKQEMVSPIKQVERTEKTSIALPTSLAEFLTLKGNPHQNTDRAMVFSYWLFKKQGTEVFNSNDIDKCYSDARLTKPTNTTDVMNTNQKKGYLVPTDEKKDNLKAWKITPSGEIYIEKELK